MVTGYCGGIMLVMINLIAGSDNQEVGAESFWPQLPGTLSNKVATLDNYMISVQLLAVSGIST
jgi:hypothetical protein